METKRISLDLSEKDHAEMERLMAFAVAASQLDAQRSPEEELQRRKAEAEQSTVTLSNTLAEMQMRGVNRAPTQNDQAEQESPVGIG